jgi:hypothetical protein
MLEALIGLFGRSVFPEDKLRAIVIKGKRNSESYVRAYNLCDGEHGVNDIAKEIGVAGPTLSPILSDWKDWGIIYETNKPGGKFYKRLYKLEEEREESAKEKTGSKPDKPSELKPQPAQAGTEEPKELPQS